MANVILDGTSLTSASLQEIFQLLTQGGAVEITSRSPSPEAARDVGHKLRVSFGFAHPAATMAAERYLSDGGAFLFLTRPSQLAELVSSLADANVPQRTRVQLRTANKAVAHTSLAEMHASLVHSRPSTAPDLGLCVGDLDGSFALSQQLLTSYQSYGPLAGKRVLVLRASHQQGAVEDELRKRCAQAVSQPLISIHPLTLTDEKERVLLNPREFGLVVFTSENTVEAYFRRLATHGQGREAFSGVPLAAIGETTRNALVKHGAEVAFMPALATGEGFAEAIAAYFKNHPTANRDILVPRALVAREALPNLLRQAGFTVATIALYENKKLTSASGAAIAELLRARAVDIALLTSGSIADGLADIVQQQNISADELSRLQLASIGSITTDAALKRGLPVSVTAQESSIAGLIRCLEQLNSELERA